MRLGKFKLRPRVGYRRCVAREEIINAHGQVTVILYDVWSNSSKGLWRTQVDNCEYRGPTGFGDRAHSVESP